MEKKEIKLIGSIDFKDIKVNVYNDPYTDKDSINCAWQMRNPDTCYQGIMYMNNETGKVSYPDDVVIPEQTDKDREILPKFIVTGYETIDTNFISFLLPKLEEGYKMRNGFVTKPKLNITVRVLAIWRISRTKADTKHHS